MPSGDSCSPGHAFILRVDDPVGLTGYLRQHGWLGATETVASVAPAGDGNMNCTLRVDTGHRTLIVKQGRPWVERYPSIPAPPERTLVEAAFYGVVATSPALAGAMPVRIGVDRDNRLLLLGDCVGFTDMTGVYEGTVVDGAAVDGLLAYLAGLHRLPVTDVHVAPFANRAMQELNHAYIFALPMSFAPPVGARLDGLTPGLGRLAEALVADRAYREAVMRLGDHYLHAAPRALVHGDYFPGSWLSRGGDVVVIDPEFCFAGAPEFDFGVMAGHLLLADQEASLVARVWRAASAHGYDLALVAGHAGVEMMRRLIGVAQLPRLVRSLEQKQALLARSRRLVLGEERLG